MKKSFGTVLITGGAGFIGSHLCEELLYEKARVICVDNLSQASLENIASFKYNQQFVFVHADCNNYNELENVFSKEKIDYVFHYAATVGVKRTQENPLKVLEDIEGIKSIFSLAHKYKIKKVVFASSSEVYGEPVELPEKENGVLNAKIPYAQVKLIGESYAKGYWEMFKLPTVSLRFFNVYGPRQESSDYGFVVGIFMKQVIEGKSPTIVGDGTMTRNFVYVKDNVRAAIQSLWNDEVNGEVLNIGTGEATTILDLAERIISLSGSDVLPTFIPLRNSHEVLHRNPDITKQTRILKFTPKYSLKEGLKHTYSWYKTLNSTHHA